MSKKSQKKYNKQVNFNKMNKQAKKDNSVDIETATAKNNEIIKTFVHEYSKGLVQDMLKAQMLADVSSSTGMYQPILSEQILQETNFNPLQATSEQIEQYLLSPQYYDMQLRGISQYLENAVGQYQKLLHYYTDQLAFNYMVLPDDTNNKGLVDKKEYINSYYQACKYVKNMNPKNKFNGMALATMQDGVSYWYKIENKDHVGFLQIPTDYCRITSSSPIGWLGEINLAFFDRMYGLSNVIPELYNAYKLFMEKRKEGLSGEALAPFQYFPLPVESTWIFTFDQNKATKVPPLANVFGSTMDVISYRNLLKDKSIMDLWKIIAMKIPKKTNIDDLMFTYEESADMVAYIQALLPDNMTCFATPFDTEPVNTNQINTLDKTITLSNENFYTSAGVFGGFFGMDTKSAKALQISQQKDFLFSSVPIYAQFNNMVNWFLKNKIKTYGWKVNFNGNAIERDSEINTALKLTTSANFPISYLASVVGFEPSDFEGLINIENTLGLKEKMHPLVSQFQASDKKQDAESGKEIKKENDGRPLEDLSTLTDSGNATRDSEGIA